MWIGFTTADANHFVHFISLWLIHKVFLIILLWKQSSWIHSPPKRWKLLWLAFPNAFLYALFFLINWGFFFIKFLVLKWLYRCIYWFVNLFIVAEFRMLWYIALEMCSLDDGNWDFYMPKKSRKPTSQP